MSDTSEGPGWWQAPNGKWYSPQTPPFHPQDGSPAPPESPGPGYWQAPDGMWFPSDTPPYDPVEPDPASAPDGAQEGSTPAAASEAVGDHYPRPSPTPPTPAKVWYRRTWVIVVALIVFFPIGLVLVWLSSWKMPTKIIVTSGVAVLLVVSLATSGSASKTTKSAQTTTSSTQATTQPPTTTPTDAPPTTTTTTPTTPTTETPTTTTPPTTVAPIATGIQIGLGPQAHYTVQPQPAPGSCHYTFVGTDPLPDANCTPGAINPQVTQANIGSTICVSGYTTTIRPPEDVTEPEKIASAAAYSYTGSLHVAEYDHLISLELGGDPNDPANLWVEPNDNPNATSTNNTKDTLENKLHGLVCSGQITLAAAQQAIAVNWIDAYQKYDT
jgi:hypothetical protein